MPGKNPHSNLLEVANLQEATGACKALCAVHCQDKFVLVSPFLKGHTVDPCSFLDTTCPSTGKPCRTPRICFPTH